MKKIIFFGVSLFLLSSVVQSRIPRDPCSVFRTKKAKDHCRENPSKGIRFGSSKKDTVYVAKESLIDSMKVESSSSHVVSDSLLIPSEPDSTSVEK